MREGKPIVEKILQTRQPAPAAEEPREGFEKSRLMTHAGCLCMRAKDGRSARGLPWTMYLDYEWRSEPREDVLSLIFADRVVEICGQHLWRLVEEINEGQLKIIQEHDAREIDELRIENLDLRPGHYKPVIFSIQVDPPFADAAREIRGDDDEPRVRAVGEGRGR